MSGPGTDRGGPPRSVRITGWGSYAPPRVVTNDELATLVPTSDEWIRTRTGVERRHVVALDPGAEVGLWHSVLHLAGTDARAAADALGRVGQDRLDGRFLEVAHAEHGQDAIESIHSQVSAADLIDAGDAPVFTKLL